MKTFGTRNYELNYWQRTGAYAVIQNNLQQFLCVEDLDGHLFLVGGGVEEDDFNWQFRPCFNNVSHYK